MRSIAISLLTCLLLTTTAAPAAEIKVSMDETSCGAQMSAEAAATIGSILISKAVGASMNALAGYVQKKAQEKQSAGNAHFGDYYYNTAAAATVFDLTAAIIRPANKFSCVTVTVTSKKRRATTTVLNLQAELQFSPDGRALRLVPITVETQGSATGLGDSRERNLEIAFQFQVPSEEGPKNFGLATLQFKGIDGEKKEWFTADLAEKYSYWSLPAPVDDATQAHIATFVDKQAEARRQLLTALEKKRLANTLQNITTTVNPSQGECGDLSQIDTQLGTVAANKAATEIRKAQAANDAARLKQLEEALAIETAIHEYLVACRDFDRAVKARDAAQKQVAQFTPFDLTVTVFESTKKPILSFIASVLGDEELQKAVADEVSDRVIDSRADEIEKTEQSAKLTLWSAYWDAQAAAEKAIAAHTAAAAAGDAAATREKEIDMQLAKRNANKAALLAGLPQPYADEAITL